MNLYKAKIRLLGSLNNEVRKHDITAAEIAILQRLHGKDGVVDVTHTGEVKKRSDRSERNRLAGIYLHGPSADGKTRLSGESFIDSVLGVGNPLPHEYTAPVETETEEQEPEDKEEIVRFGEQGEAEVTTSEPIVRTRVPKKAAKVAAENELTA